MTIKAYTPVPKITEVLPDIKANCAYKILDLIASEAVLLNPYKRVLIASELAKTIDFFLKSTCSEEWLVETLKSTVKDIRISSYLATESFYSTYDGEYCDISSLSNTSDQFGYFWPRTKEKDKAGLDKMAELRIRQMIELHPDILEMTKRNGFLDIGCGPGRYIRQMIKIDDRIKATGIDASKDIIESNNLEKTEQIEYINDDIEANKIEKEYGFVMCNGVAHHTTMKPRELVNRHSQLITKGGYYFIFLYGDDGIELYSWEILQKIVGGIPVNFAHSILAPILNPLRVQGQLDHMYGVFYRSNKNKIKEILEEKFTEVNEIPGVAELDVTRTAMKYLSADQFKYRYGEGNVRFICKK